MKKIKIIILTTVLLTGCGESTESDVQQKIEGERFEGLTGGRSAHVIRDKDTGCKYLYLNSTKGDSISVMYNQNGEVDCD